MRADVRDIGAYLATKGMDPKPTSTGEYRVNCCSCPDGDSGRHLYISADSGAFMCHRCGCKGSFGDLRRLLGDDLPRVTENSGNGRSRGPILDATVLYLVERFEPHAKAYLERRGISPETGRRFRVGYDDGGLVKHLVELGFTQDECHEAGLANEAGNDALYERVVFPNAVDGRVVHLSGRSIEGSDLKWRHTKGEISHLYNEACLKDGGSPILAVEGIVDCLAAHEMGHAAVATYGTGSAVGKFGPVLASIPDLVAALDMDEAGQETSRRLAEECCPDARLLSLPPFQTAEGKPGKDLGEFLQAGHTEEELEGLVRESKYLPEILAESVPSDTPPTRLHLAMAPVIDACARMDECAGAAVCRELLRNRFGLTRRELVPFMRRLKERHKALREESEKRAAARTEEPNVESPVPMSEEERNSAEEFLNAPSLMDRIRRDIERLGVVGEGRNALLLYFAMTSRKCARPINIEVRGRSGIGKSHIVYTVKGMMPPEDVVRHTRITAHYLDHLGADDLVHKVLLIVEAAGGEAAELSVRMLTDDTDAGLSLGYVRKNPRTEEHEAVEKTVHGPITLVQTTTRMSAHPENESRLWSLWMDETETQEKRVHQRVKSDELPHKVLTQEEADRIRSVHHAAQRLLEATHVVTPFSELVDFPTGHYRSTRDLKRFLQLIKVSALLHQRQRRTCRVKGREYIVADVRDYEVAYNLAGPVLATSAAALPESSRSLLDTMVRLQDERDAVAGHPTRMTRQDAWAVDGWDKYKTDRAIRPLEKGGWLEYNEKEKPRLYRVVRRDESHVPMTGGLLTPEELRHRIAEHPEAIDPMYLGDGEVAEASQDVVVIAAGDRESATHTRSARADGRKAPQDPPQGTLEPSWAPAAARVCDDVGGSAATSATCCDLGAT
jgi:hypothetical protein